MRGEPTKRGNAASAFAHSPPDGDWTAAHDLAAHLRAVATLARSNAEPLGCAEWAYAAGCWHDLGKYRPPFQRYIRGEGPQASHKLAGAAQALAVLQKSRLAGECIALVIAGHHSGLPRRSGDPPSLVALRDGAMQELAEALPLAPVEVTALLPDPVPRELVTALRRLPREDLETAQEVLTRLLFSALVDADYLDTARYYDAPGEAARLQALAAQDPVPLLRRRLDDHLDQLCRIAPSSPVNEQRRAILDECRAAASRPPGVFELTVPTGGGKTLAAMSFALRHAVEHGLRRVIVALPFTTIIEQNAQVYARVLGADNVLEHHSGVDPSEARGSTGQRGSGASERLWRLVAENWSAPIVVTTTVQLLESLHASAPSRCRKLHNLARSVVILDEAQTLPPHLLDTTLDTLRVLSAAFGTSIVVCTATQPALSERTTGSSYTRRGLGRPSPIVSEPEPIFAALARVQVRWPTDLDVPITWSELATQLEAERQVLAIVHRRRDAYELASRLGDDCLHLSALMLPAHRLSVLSEIRRRLDEGRCCRVVSTQLVEAGVDLDFPVVYRAMAGLDALAQAAGRCNREGKLGPHGGGFHVFIAPTAPPPGILATAAQVAMSFVRAGDRDLDDETLFCRYYARLYDSTDTDAKQLAGLRVAGDFPGIAERYRIIDDGGQIAVAVRDEERDPAGAGAIDKLLAGFADMTAMRRVRRSSVAVPRATATRWLARGTLSMPRACPVPVLDLRSWPRTYDSRFGLRIWDDPDLAADELIL